MDDFHFIRPLWLLLLLVLPLIPLWLRHHGQGQSGWARVIPDALLRPLLSEAKASPTQKMRPGLLLGLLVLITATALAGPSWREAETPLQQQNHSLVIVLDLSLSMLATDVEPDRLTRAKHKIRDILGKREGSLTGLIVYSADAHVVTPLTDDRRTIESLLGVVDPFMMPAAGNRSDLAIEKAKSLLDQGAPGEGRILLISDGVSSQFETSIRKSLRNSGYTLSTLAVGTREGGPIPLPKEGFIKDGGDVVISKTAPEELASLASATGGQSTTMTLDNTDIRTLALRSVDSDDWQDSDQNLAIARWQDDGYWLIWLMVPLALLVWRRGALLLVPLMLLPLLPQPAQAMSWDDLWSRPDQRGEQLIKDDAARAAEKFSDPAWKGSALYRAKDYKAAGEQFTSKDDANADYNRANALARQGELKQAIDAYDRALKKKPDDQDAQYNRKLVKELLKQKQQQKKKEQQKQRQQQKQNKQDQKQDKNNKDQKNGGKNQSDNQSGNKDSKDQNGQQNQKGQSGNSQSDKQKQQEKNDNSSGQQNNKGQKPKDGTGQQQGHAEKADAGDDNNQNGQSGQAKKKSSPLSQSEEQWLRRVPDDPSGLMRRKFLYQYREHNTQQPKEGDTPW